MCCCGQFWLSSIWKPMWQEVYSWSVPISPAAVIVPRSTVSVREWLLPTAARFSPAAVPRAARFCPPERRREAKQQRDSLESETGETCGANHRPAPFLFLAYSLKHLAGLHWIFFPSPAVWNFEIHKVFLQFQTLVWAKISHWSHDGLFFRVRLLRFVWEDSYLRHPCGLWAWNTQSISAIKNFRLMQNPSLTEGRSLSSKLLLENILSPKIR